MSYINRVYSLAHHKSFVAQWLENPTGVRNVMGSIPVGDSDFFFVPCLWHVDHIIPHFFTEGNIYHHSFFFFFLPHKWENSRRDAKRRWPLRRGLISYSFLKLFLDFGNWPLDRWPFNGVSTVAILTRILSALMSSSCAYSCIFKSYSFLSSLIVFVTRSTLGTNR